VISFDIIREKLNLKLDTNKFYEMLEKLNDYEKKKILKYRRYEDSLRSLMGKIIVKETLHLDKLNLGYNEWGKPYLIDINNKHFNISHSNEWVVVAISENPIGIDVQHIDNTDISIGERFFSKDESDYLSSLTEDERKDAFFKLWTLKEAFIKSEGKGLSIPLDSFSIDISNEKPNLMNKSDNILYNMSIEKLEDNYFLATCEKITSV
jgi:4'-phosphopantetheinyl transferase